MALIQFEGDLENLNESQLNFVRSILGNQDISDAIVSIQAVGKKGDNFGSFVKRISVKKNGKAFNMIAKVAPTVEIFRKAMNIELMFKNEIFMYTTVLKKFSEVLDTAEIVKKQIRAPQCYGFLSKPPHEIILLEDLRDSGYAIRNIQMPLSGVHLRIALKNIAIFHALSYIVKYKDPSVFAKMKTGVLLLKSELDMLQESKVWMIKLEEDLYSLMIEDKHKNIIKGCLSELGAIAEKTLSYDFESKYSVIQQGDYYPNNIMFNCQDEVMKVAIIDFQASRIASPASDLWYLLLSSTEYNARREHLTEWIDYYHSELTECLVQFDLNIAEVFPRAELEADLKRHAKLALSLSLMVVNAVIVKAGNEVADFKDRDDLENIDAEQVAETGRVKHLSVTTREKLKIAVKQCIDTLIEFGYLE